MRIATLGVFLFVFWLALSGHHTPMLIGAGAVCAGLCVLAALRMRTVDAEGFPISVQATATPEAFVGLSGRWSVLIDDEGKGLVENNYNLDAFFGGDLTSADGNAGVP